MMNLRSPDIKTISRRGVIAGLAGASLLASSKPAYSAGDVIVGKDGWLFPIWDVSPFSEPSLILSVTRSINAAVRIFRQSKIEVAITLLPAKSRVYRDFLPDNQKMSPGTAHRYPVAFKSLGESGAILFDHAALFDQLRQSQPEEDLFFKADTHWLPVAAGASAAEMARQIKLAGHLPPSPQPGLQLAPAKPVTQYDNDLADLLPLAARSAYHYESYMVRKPVTAGPSGLLDEDVSDTVVIGNSFMQPAYGYAAALSSQLDRPVALVWKVHQFSPYWNILSYLRSDGFIKRRPKLIVWTFHEVDAETPFDNPQVWGPTAMAPGDFLAQLRRVLAV
jgi:alginate O-acetyltransferase complex protein AlgJ